MSVEQTVVSHQMETPKSSQGAYTLPCGYLDTESKEVWKEVEVREITGNEEDMLASTQIPAYKKVSALLGGVVTRIGPVSDRGKLAQMVDDLPMGDRVFLLFAARRVTLGDDLPIREVCPECGEKHLYVVDLSELEVKEMPDPSKRIYDVTLPSGVSARFRISTGRDETTAAKSAKRQRADGLSQALLLRLELLNGEPPSLQSVKNLSLKDRLALREEFQKVEGGVDTAMDLECPSCGHEWEEDVDMGNRNFFFPSEKQKP
jgi:predicted RNA-binding Zn-ribbon protein involved in translation (DUF1610 family)